MQVIMVMIGGFIGALLRNQTGIFFYDGNSTFPIGTFIVNLIGCFALGFLFPLIKVRYPKLFLVFGTGLIGSFTTFSTFSVETLNLLEKHQYGLAIGYVMLSLTIGIFLSYLGFKIAEIFKERQGV